MIALSNEMWVEVTHCIQVDTLSAWAQAVPFFSFWHDDW